MRVEQAARVDDLVRNLVTDTRSSVQEIGFLEGTINNPEIGKKLNGSFSGHAADICIRAVVSKLVMYVCRNIEENGDSLHQFLKLIRGNHDFIEHQRRERRPDLPDSFLEVGKVADSIDEFSNDLSRLRGHEAAVWLKVHRDERLGHSLREKSGERRKIDYLEMAESDLNYTDVLEFSNEVARLVMEANRIWTFGIDNPRSRIRIFRSYTEDFWQHLPVLSEVEAS